jgi:predicted component of type VI protein secretion system
MILSYTDSTGQPRRVAVRSPRFTIGRSPENDLAVSDSNLSRRHAVIETSGNVSQLSDCGSANGTAVNGHTLARPVVLRDGDHITLGGSFDIVVSLGAEGAHVGAGGAEFASTVASVQPTYRAQPQQVAASAASPHTATPTRSSLPSWLTPPVIGAFVSALVIIVAAVLLFALTRGRGADADADESGGDTANVSREGTDNQSVDDLEELNLDETETNTPARTGDVPGSVRANDNAANASAPLAAADTSTTTIPAPLAAADSDEQISRAAKRVMGRISTDNAPYISEEGVRDVAAKVKAYRGSTAIQEKLRAMQRGCAEVNAQAQTMNLKPSLVMYAALAQSEQGGGDPVAVARQMAPKLLTLRATFGTATANSSLLLVAAYPYPFDPPIGSQTRTPHPLYTQLVQAGGHKSNVETSVARSVWFLREQKKISPEAYDLVVRLLALGIIAQSPQQYGINADPLLC